METIAAIEAMVSASTSSSREDNSGSNKSLLVTSTTTALARRRKDFIERRRNKSRQSTTISMVDSDSSNDSGEDDANNNNGDQNRDDDESTLMDEFVSGRTEVPPPPPGPPPAAPAAPAAQPKPMSKTLVALLGVTANTEIDQQSNEDASIDNDEKNCIINDNSQHSRSHTLRGSLFVSSPSMTPTSRRSNRSNSLRLNDGSSNGSSLGDNAENSNSSNNTSSNSNHIGCGEEVADQLSPRSLKEDDKKDDDDMNSLFDDFFQTIEAYSRDDDSELDDRSQHVRTFGSDEEDLSALLLLATADVGGATTTTTTTNGCTNAVVSPRAQPVEDRDMIDHVFENIENATCNRFGQQDDDPHRHVTGSAHALVPSYKSEPINVSDEADNSIIIDDTQDDNADCSAHNEDKKENSRGKPVPPSPLSFLSKIPTPKDIGKWVSTFDDATCVTNSETGEKFPAVADWVDRAFETVEETICQMTTGGPKEPSSNHHDDLSRHQFLSMEQDALDTVFETVEEHVCSESESRSTMFLMTDEEDTTAFGSTISGTPKNLSKTVLSPSSASLFGSSSFLSPKSEASDPTASTTTSFSFNDHARSSSSVLSPKHSSFSRSPASMSRSPASMSRSPASKPNTPKSISNLLSSSNESDSDLDDDQFMNVLHEYGFKDTAGQNDDSKTGHSTRGFHQHQPEPLYVITEEVSTSRSGSEQQHQTRAAIDVAPVPSGPPTTLDPLSEAAANAASAIDASLKAAEEQQEQLFAQLESYSMSSRGSTFSMSVNSTTFLARRVRATHGGFTDSCFGFGKDCGWKNAKDFFFYDEDEAREWVEEFRAGLEGAVDRVADALDALDMSVCGSSHERDDSRNHFEDDGDDTIHAVHMQPSNNPVSRVMGFPSPTNMTITSTSIPTNVRIRSRKTSTTPVSGGQSVRSTPSDEVTNFSVLTRRTECDAAKESRDPESTYRSVEMNAPEQRQDVDPPSPQHEVRFNDDDREEVPETINEKHIERESRLVQNVSDTECSTIDCDITQENVRSMHFDLDCHQDSQDQDPPRIKSPKSSETHNTFETQKTADETVATLQEDEHGGDDFEVNKGLVVKRIENDNDENVRSMTVVSMEMTSTLSNNDNNSSRRMNRTFDVSNQEAEYSVIGNDVTDNVKTNDNAVEDPATKQSAASEGQYLYSARMLPLPLTPVASFTASISGFSQHNRNNDTMSGHSRASMHGMLSAAFSCSAAAADEDGDIPKDDFEGVVVDGVMSAKQNNKADGQADKNQVSIEVDGEAMIGDSSNIYESARSNFARDGSSNSNDDSEQKPLKSSESAIDGSSDEDDMWQLRPACTDIVVYEEKPAVMMNNMSGPGGLLYLWLYMIWCSLTFWLRVNGGHSSEDRTGKKEEVEQKRISIENVLSRMSKSEDDENADGQLIKKILSNDILESMPSLEQQLSHTVETTMVEAAV